MSIREATAIESSQGTIFAYPPGKSTDFLPIPATITTPGANFSFIPSEATMLAQVIAPDLDPEQVKENLTKPYQDKAAAALKELQETISSYTETLNASRAGEWSGTLVADAWEEMLAALSEPVVALKELAEGNV